MMSYFDTLPVIERADLRPIEAKTSQFELTVNPDKVQWLYAAFDELTELKSRGGSIPGFGDFRISDETDLQAKLVLTHTKSAEDIPAPLISVFSGGGISITWHLGRKELSYKVFPEGEIVFMQLVDDEIVDDGNIALNLESSELSQLAKWLTEPVAIAAD